MRRIVPSQVCQFVDPLLEKEGKDGLMRMNSIGAATLSSALQLAEAIPDELITVDGTAYCSYITAKERIREILKTWRDNRSAGQPLFGFDFPRARNPLAVIWETLGTCPDEWPSASTSELTFIPDPELQTSLRNDLGAVNRALSNGEWKAATILAGSVVEALLLWALQHCPPSSVVGAATTLTGSGKFRKQPGTNLENWNLFEFTEVAANLGVIKPETAAQTTLAREFRNLIHPGRGQRLAQKCDRATALSAVAAVEHVVRDLNAQPSALMRANPDL